MFRNTCAKGPRATRFGWILLHLQATLPEPKSALVTEVPKAQQTLVHSERCSAFCVWKQVWLISVIRNAAFLGWLKYVFIRTAVARLSSMDAFGGFPRGIRKVF